MVILAVALLGSAMGILAALDHSLENDLRMEAIKIAQEQQEEARNMPYANIAAIPSPQTIQRQFRKTSYSFTVTTALSASALSARNVSLVSITVQWTVKNQSHSYTLQTLIRQAA